MSSNLANPVLAASSSSRFADEITSHLRSMFKETLEPAIEPSSVLADKWGAVFYLICTVNGNAWGAYWYQRTGQSGR